MLNLDNIEIKMRVSKYLCTPVSTCVDGFEEKTKLEDRHLTFGRNLHVRGNLISSMTILNGKPSIILAQIIFGSELTRKSILDRKH